MVVWPISAGPRRQARRRSRSAGGLAFAVSVVCCVVAATGCDDAVVRSPVELAPLLSVTTPAGFPADTLEELAPRDNLLTEERAQLGKRLFFDPRLSRTGQVSCGTCHQQQHGFSDPRAVSTGVDGRKGTRNAPALINAAWGISFFWDGRTRTLEEQVGMPIVHPDEMDLPLADAIARLSAEPAYARQFAAAYGEPPSELSLRKALASFLRALVSGNSPYDRHLRGDDSSFGEAARRGEEIFTTETGGCFHCHPSGMLTNEGFFNNGTFLDGEDPGRQGVTGRPGDLGKFKVPALRNIAVTAPYMHDGSLATLEDVIEHYDRGGLGHVTTDPQVEPLGLSPEQKADLLAFLRSLTDVGFLEDDRYRPGP